MLCTQPAGLHRRRGSRSTKTRSSSPQVEVEISGFQEDLFMLGAPGHHRVCRPKQGGPRTQPLEQAATIVKNTLFKQSLFVSKTNKMKMSW